MADASVLLPPSVAEAPAVASVPLAAASPVVEGEPVGASAEAVGEPHGRISNASDVAYTIEGSLLLVNLIT